MTEEIEDWTGKVHQGDAREKLKEMPDESVDMVITSPPYYGLRSYGDEEMESIWGGENDCEHSWDVAAEKSSQGGHNTDQNPSTVGGNKQTQKSKLRGQGGIESNYCSKCGAWKGQLGLEPSPFQFVQNLTEIFKEAYRVLKPAGSFYLNLGDTFAGGGGGVSGKPDDWDDQHNDDIYPDSVPARDVCFSDKCKMLIPHRVAISLINDGWICRNDIVWSKPNPMPESVTDRRSTKFEYIFHFVKQKNYYYNLDSIREPYARSSLERAEYAFDGTNDYEPGNAEGFSEQTVASKDGKNPGDIQEITTANYSGSHFGVFPLELIKPHIKSSCPESGIVLDPFIGSGTTAVVAEQLEREWIGIDLNKDYVDMSYERVEQETKKIYDDRSIFDY